METSSGQPSDGPLEIENAQDGAFAKKLTPGKLTWHDSNSSAPTATESKPTKKTITRSQIPLTVKTAPPSAIRSFAGIPKRKNDPTLGITVSAQHPSPIHEGVGVSLIALVGRSPWGMACSCVCPIRLIMLNRDHHTAKYAITLAYYMQA